MPRIYCIQSGKSFDYCKICWEDKKHVEQISFKEYDNDLTSPILDKKEWKLVIDGNGRPHPDYSDGDYQCRYCKKILSYEDN